MSNVFINNCFIDSQSILEADPREASGLHDKCNFKQALRAEGWCDSFFYLQQQERLKGTAKIGENNR